jgi:hypothetical protein
MWKKITLEGERERYKYLPSSHKMVNRQSAKALPITLVGSMMQRFRVGQDKIGM